MSRRLIKPNLPASKLVPEQPAASTSRLQLVRDEPLFDKGDVKYIMEVQMPAGDVRRRSPRLALARFIDKSVLVELGIHITEVVRFVNDTGDKSSEPRVLISQAAKDIWDEGPWGSFAYVTMSSRRLTGQRVPPMPAVRKEYPIDVALTDILAPASCRLEDVDFCEGSDR
jgi:hypothetical protein